MAPGTSGDDRLVVVGQIAGVYGVRGWVKIRSYTAPQENLFKYQPWTLRASAPAVPASIKLLQWRVQGKGLIAQFDGYSDRDQAALLNGAEILVQRSALPKPKKDEYYWSDLIGLRVINREAIELGVVDHLLETGANDVLVVKGAEKEHLVPWVPGPYVLDVNLAEGVIRVDWDADF
jgi:16S rRNA processing protein RimM